MSPRAPALASSEVASHYVEYNRGPVRGLLFTFAVILFGFALVAALGWNQLGVGLISAAVGLALLTFGLQSHLAMSELVRDDLSASRPPEDPQTHQPD